MRRHLPSLTTLARQPRTTGTAFNRSPSNEGGDCLQPAFNAPGVKGSKFEYRVGSRNFKMTMELASRSAEGKNSHHKNVRPDRRRCLTASVKARCLSKAPSEPPSSTAAGGAFRRSCLSPQSGRVLRRPPDASSAGESSAKPTTGEAGSPFLVTSLATQRSNPPAGAGPGRRNAKQRKAAVPHQRLATPPAPLRPQKTPPALPHGGVTEGGAMRALSSPGNPPPCG